MVKQTSRINDPRRKVTALVSIARWLWIINSLVALIGIISGRYDVAALAAFTWVMSLLVAAFGSRAALYLSRTERVIRTS